MKNFIKWFFIAAIVVTSSIASAQLVINALSVTNTVVQTICAPLDIDQVTMQGIIHGVQGMGVQSAVEISTNNLESITIKRMVKNSSYLVTNSVPQIQQDGSTNYVPKVTLVPTNFVAYHVVFFLKQ